MDTKILTVEEIIESMDSIISNPSPIANGQYYIIGESEDAPHFLNADFHDAHAYYVNGYRKLMKIFETLKSGRGPTEIEIFERLTNDNKKWDEIKRLKDSVIWLCAFCKHEITDEEKGYPTHAFMGTKECNTCGEILTERHNGGMYEPCNYTYKLKTEQ